MSGVHISFPYWYLLVSAVIGLAYALFLYFRTRDFKGKPKWLIPTLGALRFLSIASIVFLLLNPILRNTTKNLKKTLVLIAMDNSSSINKAWHNPADSANFLHAINALQQNIRADYQVETLLFGEAVREDAALDFQDRETDLSEVLSSAYKTYRNENIGALILATDGNYNKGLHPLYTRPQLQAPIYVIAMGDTTSSKDVSISAVYHNDIAYLGDHFNVHVDLKATLLKGQRGKLRILGEKQGGFKTLDSQEFAIDQSDYFKSFTLSIPAVALGYRRFIVQVTPLGGEQNTDNNTSNFYVDILKSKQRILILADGPHPDVGAINQALEANKNNEVSIQYADEYDFSPQKTDLIILHQLPSYKHPITTLLQKLKKERFPTLFITGLRTQYIALNEAQDAVFVRPGNQAQVNEVTATINREFNGFHLSDDLVTNLERFPSLVTAYGDFTPKPNAHVLLYQKILKTKTPHPLLSFSNRNGRKCGVFCAEGVYKWRLYNYLSRHSNDLMEELIQNTVRYLVVKEDKSRFRVRPIQPHFKESDPVKFYAERYNSIYEKDNREEVEFQLIDSAKKTYQFAFSKTEDAYSLDLGKLPAGSYKYSASTQIDGRKKVKSGTFTVSIIDIENIRTNANLPILNAMAERSGGAVIFPDQIETLLDKITKEQPLKPIAYLTQQTRPLIHLKWPLFALLFLLSMEWFLRRYYGQY